MCQCPAAATHPEVLSWELPSTDRTSGSGKGAVGFHQSVGRDPSNWNTARGKGPAQREVTEPETPHSLGISPVLPPILLLTVISSRRSAAERWGKENSPLSSPSIFWV